MTYNTCLPRATCPRRPRLALLLLLPLLTTTAATGAEPRVPPQPAGRAFAAYGGIYIIASLCWLWLVEGKTPDRFDLAGAALCLAGSGVILLAPRA